MWLLTLHSGFLNASATSVATQSDGKIVVTGYITQKIYGEFGEGYKSDFAIARYNTNGTLDITFSDDGKQVYFQEGNTDNYSASVAIQRDGKIIVTGYSPDDYGTLLRYNSNGTFDSTFSKDGKQTIVFEAKDVAIQSDGKIVVAQKATVLISISPFHATIQMAPLMLLFHKIKIKRPILDQVL